MVKKESLSVKRLLFVWFFFIICCSTAFSFTTKSTLIPKAADDKHLAKERQLIQNVYSSKVRKSKSEVESRSKALKGLHEVLHPGINVSKGKETIGIHRQSKKANRGVYGGGDLLKPKGKKGAASSFSLKSSSSMAIMTLALGLPFLVLF